MFRLVKVLNGNNQYDARSISYTSPISFSPGCVIACQNGTATTPSATAMPEYIALAYNNDTNLKKVTAMHVTEDMIFKVEYTGSMTPTVGMSVGLATKERKMDAVSYNANGKGTIIELDGKTGLVYVKFRK